MCSGLYILQCWLGRHEEGSGCHLKSKEANKRETDTHRNTKPTKQGGRKHFLLMKRKYTGIVCIYVDIFAVCCFCASISTFK